MGASNIHWHGGIVTREDRAKALNMRGATIWFTGLSGSGKSTVAAALEKELLIARVPCYRLDGDNLRTGLNADLGFSDRDRTENVRRLGEVSHLFADAGVVVLVSAISPLQADRDAARRAHQNDRNGPLPFLEAYVKAPLDVCESRDPKGLYKKARRGEIASFTGIDSPYEAPTSPEILLDTARFDVTEGVATCLASLRGRGVIA